MNTAPNEHPLVLYLLELSQKQDRGALAALRSGVGKRPGDCTRMFPYIVRFLHGGGADSPQVLATFLTASLFAAHPSHAPIGNLGASLRRAVAGKHGREGVTARFTAVLDADPEDLPRRLVELVRLCESAGAPLDWTRFYWDVYRLIGQDQDARDKTRLAWAKGFWSQPQEENQTPKLQEKQP